MSPLHFSIPSLLLLLAGVVVALVMVLLGIRWKQQAEARFASPARLAVLAPSRSRGRRVLKAGLLLSAVGLVVLAAARPWWNTEEATLTRRGVDIVIVLDVSLSMLAGDVTPSRFARAQDELNLFLERLSGDRVGLVFFASSGTIRAPLTSDTEAIKQLIARAPEDAAFLSPGSSLAEGVRTALTLLRESKTAGRAILIVSDGEDFSGGAIEAAAEARAVGVVVYTAGVGTAVGGPIPVRGPGGQESFKLDPQTNQPVVTRANEGLLRAVAQAGGGRFLSLNGTWTSLPSLADDLSRMELTTFAEEGRYRPVERFPWFGLAALALLLTDLLIPEWRPVPDAAVTTRRRRLVPLPFAFLTLIVGCTATTAYMLNEQGNAQYYAGDVQAALGSYQRAQQERPDLPELNYNAGNALHRLGNFERAVQESRRATDSDRTSLRAKAYYNLGNHYYRQDKLREAFEAYRSALIYDPNDEDAKFNLEMVLRRLQGQDQPPGPLSPQGESGQGEPAQPGAQQSQPGTAQPPGGRDRPGTGNEEQGRRALEEALRGIHDRFTVEDAFRILDLLRQQQIEQARQRSLQPGTRSTAPDW